MRLTGRGEPHTDVIDSGLHEGAGAMFGIDGQLCADDFDEVGAGECGLLDALRGGHQPFPIQRCQRGFCAGLGGLAPRGAIDRQAAVIAAPLRR